MKQHGLVLIGALLLFPMMAFCQSSLKEKPPLQRSPKEVEAAQKAFEARKAERTSPKKAAVVDAGEEAQSRGKGREGATIRRVVAAGTAIPGNDRYRYIEKDKATKPSESTITEKKK